MQKIRENGTLQEMLLMYQQMALQFAQQIDPALAEQVANQILSQSGQPTPQPMIQATMPSGEVEGEHPNVEKARYTARTSTEVD